jgi:hypothetical protein
MGKLLVAVITLGALGFLAYKTMYGSLPGSAPIEDPKERLDNVRGAAKRIEAGDQQRADDILKATE